jgi:predicted small metal-binding protein
MAASGRAFETHQSRITKTREDDMRAIDCPCGHRLEGADDAELFRLAREHIGREHPEMQRTDEPVRERVAADLYDVQPST